jgi:hypothetical protein
MKIKTIAVHTLSHIVYTLSLNHNGDISIKISLLYEALCRIEDSSCGNIPRKCSQVYIWCASSSIETRLKEYHQDICVQHLDKLALVEHIISVDYLIQVQKTNIVPANSDATEIGHQPNSMNWADDLYLIWSWKSLLYCWRNTDSKDWFSALIHIALFRAQTTAWCQDLLMFPLFSHYYIFIFVSLQLWLI